MRRENTERGVDGRVLDDDGAGLEERAERTERSAGNTGWRESGSAKPRARKRDSERRKERRGPFEAAEAAVAAGSGSSPMVVAVERGRAAPSSAASGAVGLRGAESPCDDFSPWCKSRLPLAPGPRINALVPERQALVKRRAASGMGCGRLPLKRL